MRRDASSQVGAEMELLDYCAAFFRERQVEAYLVGGALRDELLRRERRDLDIAVARDALPLARALADRLRGAFFPIDVERDTARVLVPGGMRLDVALLRGGTILTDLAARDFTINAMARRIDAPGDVLDPHQGRRDLSEGIVRVVSADALDSDPVRLLRAVRLAAALEFHIESQTSTLIRSKAPYVRAVSAERIRDELVHILELARSAPPVRALNDYGLLPVTAPGAIAREELLARLTRREKFAARAQDGDDESQWFAGELGATLTGGRARLVTFKFAALFDDAHAFRRDAEHLHFSRHEVEYGEALVRHRLRLAESTADELGAFRFFRQTGAAGVSLLAAALADDGDSQLARQFARWHRDAFERVVAPKPLVPGSEIAAMVGGQGAAIGRTITALLEAQVSRSVRTREEALAFLAAYRAPHEDSSQ